MARKPNTSTHAKAVLAELSAQPLEWHYGYDVMKRTGIKSGTLYPLLIRFHEQGILESEWRPSDIEGRPPRHAYRLTASGLALARKQNVEARSTGSLILRPADQ